MLQFSQRIITSRVDQAGDTVSSSGCCCCIWHILPRGEGEGVSHNSVAVFTVVILQVIVRLGGWELRFHAQIGMKSKNVPFLQISTNISHLFMQAPADASRLCYSPSCLAIQLQYSAQHFPIWGKNWALGKVCRKHRSALPEAIISTRSVRAPANVTTCPSRLDPYLCMQVGMWAERNLPTADPPMLAAFEELLDEENPDLLKWLTGQLEPPAAMRKNPAFVVRPCQPSVPPFFVLPLCYLHVLLKSRARTRHASAFSFYVFEKMSGQASGPLFGASKCSSGGTLSSREPHPHPSCGDVLYNRLIQLKLCCPGEHVKSIRTRCFC